MSSIEEEIALAEAFQTLNQEVPHVPDIPDAEMTLLLHINATRHEYVMINERINILMKVINTNHKNTMEMVALYENLKSAFRVIGWIERPAIWVTKLAAASVVLWAVWKFLIIEAVRGNPK